MLWNQRWEYDKGPDEFADAVVDLLDDGVEFDVALAGERFGDTPAALDRLRSRLGTRLVHDGHASSDRYRSLLAAADCVVSTARHEFFGVAVVEAMAAGAFPVLPDRFVYPEHVPPSLRARCLYRSPDGLRRRLRWVVEHLDEARALTGATASAARAHDWSLVAPRYDETLSSLR